MQKDILKSTSHLIMDEFESLKSHFAISRMGCGGRRKRPYAFTTLQLLVAEIVLTNNLIILAHCKDDLQREFYIRMTRKFGWRKNMLVRQGLESPTPPPEQIERL